MIPAFLTPLAAFAYDVKQADSGDPLRWRRWPLEYTWGGGAPPEVDAPDAEVAAAFEAWARVLGPDAFRPVPSSGVPTEAADATNWVWVSDEWPFDPELLALTSSWTRADGTLVAFDIRLNGARPWASDGGSTAYDLRAAITHEIGHAIGLDHSDVEEATMYATAGMGEVWRAELAADDEDGVRFLYPDGAMRPFPWGCATGSGPGSVAAIAWAAGLLAQRRRSIV